MKSLRVISLVPSQTELLYYLGVEPIAQTIFCIHPAKKFKSAVKIGGTKKLNLKKILSLNPDLIIGNKEENTKEQITYLQQHAKVWISDINTFDEALEAIVEIGQLVNKEPEALDLKAQISTAFKNLKQAPVHPKTLYLIWKNPYMAAGRQTFIHSMLQKVGYQNSLATSRYPTLELEEIIALNPEVILLSSEPYPFKEKDIIELQKALPKARVKLVDGEMFSWYGNRMLLAAQYMASLHPI